jgi:protein-S-isoprenylcysteine O-methyltransferase Ste14
VVRARSRPRDIVVNRLVHIPPPFYALVLLAVSYALAEVIPRPFDLSWPLPASAFIALGLAGVLWAWLHFWTHRTTPIPTGRPSALVTGGPYRWSRNPMYLGIGSCLVGIVFLAGSPAFLLAPTAFYIVADRVFIPYEEAKLQGLFGAHYVDFKRRVRRWL